jgi:hypothetical protein
MTVTIKAQFVRSNPSEGLYRLQVDVIDVTNIDFDVLVFDTEDDTFSRVASVYDMETWLVGKIPAETANHAYYRGRGAQVDFLSILDATAFESVSENRLKILAVAWNSIIEAFSGTDIVSVDSNVTT